MNPDGFLLAALDAPYVIYTLDDWTDAELAEIYDEFYEDQDQS